MILQSVPPEDCDDQHLEHAALYGRSSGSAASPVETSSSRAAVWRRRARDVASAASWDEPEQLGCRLGFLGACCCLGAVAVGACLALLQRLAAEAQRPAASEGPVLAFFSYAPSTDAALAWLAAALLAGELPVAPAGRAPFAPRDGDFLGLWQPAAAAGSARPRALAHGGVSGMLRRVHGLGPPRVADLTRRAGAGPGAAVPEADAFLAIRALLAEAEERQEEGQAARRGRAGPRRLGRRAAELVLVSHPHHLPYLAALAGAAGFRPLGLEPGVYGALPWADFGCDALGYPAGASPQAGLQQEAGRLQAYAASLHHADEKHRRQTQPIIEAANATLRFHLCVAASMARRANATSAAERCSSLAAGGRAPR